MGNRVGPKGQVVISKPTRDRLGILPGWEAVERIIDDHLELRFIAPAHERSLLGILAKHVRRRPRGRFSRAQSSAWLREAREKDRRSRS